MKRIDSRFEDLILSEINEFQEKVSCANVGIVIQKQDERFEHTSNYQGSSGSLIKVFQAAAVYQFLLEKEILPREASIQIGLNLISGGSMLDPFIKPVESLEKVLEYLLQDSCNASANHLIDLIGQEAINKFISSKGFTNTKSEGLFKRSPDFREGNIVDGPYISNRTSANDVTKLMMKIFELSLYDRSTNHYHVLNPEFRLRRSLEKENMSTEPIHPLAGYLDLVGGRPSRLGDKKPFKYMIPFGEVVIGQKFGIQFYDFGVAGYVYPIKQNGHDEVYFISILINGFKEPLRDHSRFGTETCKLANIFISNISRIAYSRFLGNGNDASVTTAYLSLSEPRIL